MLTMISMYIFATNVPAGPVSGTWTLSGSPYIVQGDITIANNTTLTINPGVEVKFNRNTGLSVYGRLVVNGNTLQRVKIKASNATYGWNGIYFSAANNTLINSADISDVKNKTALNFENTNGIQLLSCSIINNNVDTVLFPMIESVALRLQNTWNVVIDKTVISNNQITYNSSNDYDGTVIKISQGYNIQFTGNEVKNNSGEGILHVNNLQNINSPFTMDSNDFSYNTSSGSGTISMSNFGQNSIIISNNNICYNVSTLTGGLNFLGSNYTINGNTITNNQGTLGGGLYYSGGDNYNTVCMIQNNKILYNNANYGGGVFIAGKSDMLCTIQNNEISYNKSSYGAGLYITRLGGSFVNSYLKENSISFNEAYNQGAGIYLIGCNFLPIMNCNVTYNIGTGISLHQGINTEDICSVDVLNSNIWGNSNQIAITGTNPNYLISRFRNSNITSGIQGIYSVNPNYYTSSNIINVDPGFVDKYSYDWHISSATNPVNYSGIGGSFPSYIGLYPYSQGTSISQHNRSLKQGWTWLSFPKLQRNADDDASVSVLSVINNINPYGMILSSQVASINYIYPSWQTNQNFTTLQSSKGYKVQTSATCNLNLNGTTLNPNTVITLNPNTENWVGYFMPYTMYVQDALGAELMNNLTSITTEKWSMQKTALGWISSSMPKTLSFGDMVILTTSSTETIDFQWSYGQLPTVISVQEVSSFTYTDQANYVPVYVNINEEEAPTEIGLFVNGECRGASVYQGEITQVNAYLLEEDLNQEITFQFAYDSKSPKKISNDFCLLDPNTMNEQYIPLTVQAGKPYYYVKFADRDESSQEKPLYQLQQNYPNPFNPDTKIDFYLSKDQNIQLSIYNIKGQRIRELYSGQINAGKHQLIWDGKDNNRNSVSSGIYFYKLTTPSGSVQRKMTLIK